MSSIENNKLNINIQPTPLEDFLIFYGIKYDNIEIEMEKYNISNNVFCKNTILEKNKK